MFFEGLKRLWPVATVALAVGIAWSQSDSVSVVSASDAETAPDPAETEWQPTYQYISLPPSVTPLNGLLPFGGIGSSPTLMSTSKGQVFSHDIDVSTREMDVSEKRVNSVSRDTTTLWTAHYPELADYVSDMYSIGQKSLWLNDLVGKANDGYETPWLGQAEADASGYHGHSLEGLRRKGRC